MKKSKILDEMTCVILSHSATYPQYPLDNLLTLAKSILEKQEELGMLPPIKSIPERCMCSMRSSCIDCSPSLYKTTWEEE